MMPISLKYVGRFFLLIACLSSMKACSKPNEKVLTPIPTKKSVEVFNLEKENTFNKKDRIAGSKVSGKWIYGNNGSIACRIKEWYVVGTKDLSEIYIDVEVTNIKSKKPINAVYELLVIDTEGQVVRTISNAYKDNQPNITAFKPPLQKGQTKVSQIYRKFTPVMSKVDLKNCRVAGNKEDAFTINPEMKDYVGP
jgi:hypothetical protein